MPSAQGKIRLTVIKCPIVNRFPVDGRVAGTAGSSIQLLAVRGFVA